MQKVAQTEGRFPRLRLYFPNFDLGCFAGRMFRRAKGGTTPGERDIIAGIMNNRGARSLNLNQNQRSGHQGSGNQGRTRKWNPKERLLCGSKVLTHADAWSLRDRAGSGAGSELRPSSTLGSASSVEVTRVRSAESAPRGHRHRGVRSEGQRSAEADNVKRKLRVCLGRPRDKVKDTPSQSRSKFAGPGKSNSRSTDINAHRQRFNPALPTLTLDLIPSSQGQISALRSKALKSYELALRSSHVSTGHRTRSSVLDLTSALLGSCKQGHDLDLCPICQRPLSQSEDDRSTLQGAPQVPPSTPKSRMSSSTRTRSTGSANQVVHATPYGGSFPASPHAQCEAKNLAARPSTSSGHNGSDPGCSGSDTKLSGASRSDSRASGRNGSRPRCSGPVGSGPNGSGPGGPFPGGPGSARVETGRGCADSPQSGDDGEADGNRKLRPQPTQVNSSLTGSGTGSEVDGETTRETLSLSVVLPTSF